MEKQQCIFLQKKCHFGTIKASLQEFYIGSAQEDYKNHSATIIEKDTQGNPTLWSFELPHEDEYINVNDESTCCYDG